MLKKIIAILIPVLIIGSIGVYFYHHQEKSEVPDNIAIKAIPIDASFVIESHKTLPLWKNISKNNDIWKELEETPFFSVLNNQLNALDSLIKENPDLENILENEPLFVSAHLNGMNHFNYLFVCSVPARYQSSLTTYLTSLKGNSPANNLQYEETTIHCVQIDEKTAFYYTVSNDIFIASFGPALIKEAMRQLESGISLMNDAYFTKVLNASGEQSEANLFINLQTFTNVSSTLFNKSFLPTLSSLQDFGQWMGMDITIHPDELIMTGFTDCDSTGTQFLNTLQHQSSGNIRIASVAPFNTAFMMCHDFSDYGTFHKNYLHYRGIHNKDRNRAEWLDRIEQTYDINIEKYFYPWIGDETAEVITEPSDSSMQNDTYVLIEANDVNVAINRLSALADTIASKKELNVVDSNYMHHEIRNLNLDNVTGNILGSSFYEVTRSWFTSVGNYIVFANNINALKTFIYQYEEGNTLEKDSYYKDFIKQHVESESGIYVYNNTMLSPVFYAKYLDKPYTADLRKYKSLFEKFHGISLQFSYMQGMFYTNVYVKRNSTIRKDVMPLWQTALDTVLAVSPSWVKDYISQQQYIMTEDKNESVYLLDNNGHIEWKKKIDGFIESPIFQVDALRNHKLQYVFNTANTITMLDRKGNFINGFPVRFNYSASAPLAVLDYDNDRKYKILIPCSDLKIHEYDINGKPVKGWKLPETSESVKCPVHYCRVAKKDYIVTIDDEGKVYVFDRKGEENLHINNRMPSHLHDFYLFAGTLPTNSYIIAADSLGTVFKLSLSGELSTVSYFKDTKNNIQFVPGPIDSIGKQELFFLNGSNLLAYNAGKTERFRVKIKNEPGNILLFDIPGHSLLIGTTIAKDEQLYLWDNTGNLYTGFPLHGSGTFSIADMKNDGSLYLLTGADNKVYVYTMP